MAADVQVIGLARLRATMRKAGIDLADLKAANAAAAATVAAAAAARAPRRSGRLAGSVRGNRALGRAVISAGSAAVPYAGPIHWGWPARHIAADPFITEAARATETGWLAGYALAVNRALSTVRGA